ncbi:MAG: HEPN domain-containing protein [Fibrobacterota bacterium]
MPDTPVRELVNYRLERANEALDEAAMLLKACHANAAMNRLYYACFYAVSALLLKDGLSAVRHSGVRALFHQHYIRTKVVSEELGRRFDKFFERRQKSDYADMARYNVNEIAPLVAEANDFVKTIASLAAKV